MKTSKAIFLTVLVCVVIFGVITFYQYKHSREIIHTITAKIDETLEQNTATLNGALDSFNTVIAQKDLQLEQLEKENTQLAEREGMLVKRIAEQEANVAPILEQYPEVAQLVFTLKETISVVQAENENLRGQVILWHSKYDEAITLNNTLLEQNAKLASALEDVKGDLHRALLITKSESTLETVGKWAFRGLIVYATLK